MSINLLMLPLIIAACCQEKQDATNDNAQRRRDVHSHHSLMFRCFQETVTSIHLTKDYEIKNKLSLDKPKCESVFSNG
jgi:hypothetical protein